MKRNFHCRWTVCAAALTACLLTGCARAPIFDVMGSLFPAWLVCLGLGIILSALAHGILLRRKIVLAYPILVYPGITAIFTFLLWLLFFS